MSDTGSSRSREPRPARLNRVWTALASQIRTSPRPASPTRPTRPSPAIRSGRRRMPVDNPPGDEIRVSGPLPPEQAAAVLDLVRHAAEEDGVNPLSEHVMLHLRYGGDRRARNVLLWHDGELAGYAHLDPTDPVEGPAGEMVIHPGMRRQGLGRMLTQALVAEAGNSGLRLWAHGDLPAAARLAAAAGFSRSRALWQMRRSLQTW